MPEQVLKKLTDLGLLDVLAVQLEVQADTPALRTDRERRDGGDPVVLVAVLGAWGLAARSPGAPYRRNQEEPGFVDKGDMGAQPRGVFFMRGQSRCFHSAMASSLRWSARRSGFWQLQPSEWSSRPT